MPQKQLPTREAPKSLTPEQKLLAANFTAALAEEGAPTPGQIAEACGISEQAVSNWKRTGKITKQNLHIVASMTKWSVSRLLTGRLEAPPPPPPGFADRREPEQQVHDDLAMLPEDEQKQWIADLHERAEKYRAVVREHLKKFGPKGKE